MCRTNQILRASVPSTSSVTSCTGVPHVRQSFVSQVIMSGCPLNCPSAIVMTKCQKSPDDPSIIFLQDEVKKWNKDAYHRNAEFMRRKK